MSNKKPAVPSCQQIINSFPEPFVIIDRHYQILSANERYARHYGYDSDDIIGRRCHEVSHRSAVPCSQNGEHCPLDTVFQTAEATQVMHVHYDAEGREERVQITATPLFDSDGKLEYMGELMTPVFSPLDSEGPIVGRSPAILHMISLLQRVAPTRSTVLLTGESGVGKECAAEYLHHYSSRASQPFIVVDCGTLGENLIESELFGHVKGAFTGAASHKKGLFEAANGGTLFIDEIGELPLELQTKLLRVLESGRIRPIGGTDYKEVDVRVVAATNRDLQHMIREGGFRADLYYRLSAFPVNTPPLRERQDDIPLLAEHFLHGMENGDAHIPLSTEVIERLLSYDYPGNVREMRNIIERAVILAAGEVLTPQYFLFADNQMPEYKEPAHNTDRQEESRPAPVRDLLTRRGSLPDPDSILQALEVCQGHRAQAADMLGISERTLYRHLQKLRKQA
ncbi:MAG: sigma 54-interacting transcriptional regulator [gamma proteobacterium symbiont of Bathyaustriella thionipta]|nr:sigma 54-interacting transcriptional regulator [gamma proteobacterium symbiont of Bathyaustriella thionipta]